MRMVSAIGCIEDDLILEAMVPPAGNKSMASFKDSLGRKTAPWLNWGGVAVCLIALIIAGVAILPLSSEKNKQSLGDGRYKNFTIQDQEAYAIVWPWEYQTVGEKYTTIVVNGMEYGNSGNCVASSMIKEMVGVFEVTGYDEIKRESRVISAEAYELNEVAASRILAVKLEDDYYIFRNFYCQPADTLGELLDQVNLPKLVKLNWFEERGSESQSKRYVLNDASYLWKVLTEECREARFIDDQNWMTVRREYLGFSISSDALGVCNVALYVTKDGYLWTNAFGAQTLYDIGEESAGKIIQHCRENSTEIEAKPFANAIMGTITEITEEYLIVDDSSLCKDPKDGIAYKVLLNDVRICRYLWMNMIKEGDTVEVLYRDPMNEEGDHTIDSATHATKITIIDGKANILE